jgi:hypothetical protein
MAISGSPNGELFVLAAISSFTFAPLHLCAFALESNCIDTA